MFFSQKTINDINGREGARLQLKLSAKLFAQIIRPNRPDKSLRVTVPLIMFILTLPVNITVD